MNGYKIEGLTISVTDMPSMLDFYSHVFEIEFSQREMQGYILYSGTWCGIQLLLCPKELSRIEATQNRHQFDLIVTNIEQVVARSLDKKGTILSDLAILKRQKTAAVYDPDGNSIVFKEILVFE